MSPPTRLDDYPAEIVFQSKSQHQTNPANEIGASAGLLHSAANQIIMIAGGNQSMMFITLPYNHDDTNTR